MNTLQTILALSAITLTVVATTATSHAFNPGNDISDGHVAVADLAASPRTGISLKNATKFGPGAPDAGTIYRPQFEETDVN